MIYKMKLTDSSDSMTFDLLEVPIVGKDIEGAVDNTTLDGNVYTDYLWLKKQYMQKWAILCDTEYTQLRGFYTRQFENATIPTYRLYYGTNNFLDKTVSGEYITTTVSGIEQAPITDISLLGNTEQTTYSGKNLISARPSSGSANGITWTLNSDGSVTVSGTATANQVISFGTVSMTQGQTYTLSGCPSGGALGKYILYTNVVDPQFIDTGSGATHAVSATATAQVYFIIYIGRTINETIYPMLEIGSSASPYEPYVGGTASPNPDYPQAIDVVTGEQTVKITGKNLLIYPYKHGTSTIDGVTFTDNGDGSITVNGTSTASTQSLWYFYENTWNYNSLSFELEAGTYTFKGLGVNNVGMACNFYFSDNTNEYFYIGQNDVTKTITQKARLNIRLVVSRGVTVDNVTIYPQTEIGSTATAYEPYQGQSYAIDLGSIELCKIGTYQDYIWNDNGTWKVHKAVGKVTFDGSETWVMSSSGGLTRFASPTITGASSVASRSVIISDYFHYVASGNEIGAGFIYATQFFAYPTADITTASDFKTWLGTHNTTVYYILATPTDTEITNSALIAQLDALEATKLFLGVNNITTETENEQPTMNIKYTEIYDRETDVVSTTAVRLTLTDDGVINNCGCRQNVQLTMRETVS